MKHLVVTLALATLPVISACSSFQPPEIDQTEFQELAKPVDMVTGHLIGTGQFGETLELTALSDIDQAYGPTISLISRSDDVIRLRMTVIRPPLQKSEERTLVTDMRVIPAQKGSQKFTAVYFAKGPLPARIEIEAGNGVYVITR